MEGYRINENFDDERSEDLLTITAEKASAGGGKPDFIISKEISSVQGKKQKSVVMLIEFGLGHEFWWKKQDQILLYVESLLRNRKETSSNETYTFDKPILLTIITANKKTNDTASAGNRNESKEGIKPMSNVGSHIKHEGEDYDICFTTKANEHQAGSSTSDINTVDQSLGQTDGSIYTEDITAQTMEVRIGIFLCTRKNAQNGYRVALLCSHAIWKGFFRCANVYILESTGCGYGII